ncbi:MAG TPA: phosphatase [Actinomycetota bacterium]|jgi:hypothetical protein|nr:phosphatase [Actinomycetota bacterium]
MPHEILERAREELEAAGITGAHRSHSRANVLKKINEVISGDTDDTFGLSGLDRHSPREVLGLVSRLTGCWTDPDDVEGFDRIDPDLTMQGLVEAGRALGEAARAGALLLVATGHPTGMLECYMEIASAYRDLGGKVLRPLEDESLPLPGRKPREVRYIGGVACLADWGALLHTHSASAMEALLEVDPRPDIVLGDHGFAGAAIERGIRTVAVMDINDPALAIAAAEGRIDVIVPLDDNRLPRAYEPAWTVVNAAMRDEL